MPSPLAQSKENAVSERIVLDGPERRQAILDAIGAARERVRLSMFRCTDFKVMDKLAEAMERKVNVELLLTQRAKGWEKKIRELGKFLESMGAQVYRYDMPGVKYHAKYLVVDERIAIVTSGNLTLKCFEETNDFLLVTGDAGVIHSLARLFDQDAVSPGNPLPDAFSPRLIVGPELARKQMSEVLSAARKSLRIVDHKIKDPEMVAMLRGREESGLDIKIYGSDAFLRRKSHGKLAIVDGARAVFGSISLSAPSLSKRRELSVVVEDAGCVATLRQFLETSGHGNKASSALAVKAKNADTHDDDDSDDE